MSTAQRRKVFSWLDHTVLGALLLLAAALLVMAAVQPVRAAEIIPQIGMTRSIDGGDEAKSAYGLAVRGDLAPMLQAEIGGSYRKEPQFAGAMDVVQWPVTASLWVRPLPAIYAGGGAGWYHTTLQYADHALPSTTTEKFGAHLGGGIELPVVPRVASLDLSGRYVYLGSQTTELPLDRWKASFWTTTAGLALHF